MSKENSASRSLALSFYTFLSRILGLIRDHYMAVSFGTGMIASAFSVAYRLPNMYRNLLAEGTLSQSFMPIYSDASKESPEEAKHMSGAVLTFLFFLLLLFVILFILAAPFFIPFLVGGTPEYSNLIIKLSLILFVLIMSASLASIFMAISNSQHKFFVPSLSPIILNLSYLFVFIVIFSYVEDALERIYVLCFGIVFGGFLQLIVQGFYVYKLELGPKLNIQWKHPAIKKIFSLMLPAVVGGGFYQIGLLVDIFLANYIQNQNPGLGAVVSLDYAQRLIQFPTGIIGVALATTTLPTLLSSLKNNDIKSIPNELVGVLSFSLYLTLPATFGFIIMGRTIIDSIYFGGKWDYNSTASTVYALSFYSLAIPFFSMNKVLTSSFYAFKDTKTPLRINFISFTTNMLLNIILIQYLKHAGLALSSASAATLTCILLITRLKKHSVDIPLQKIFYKIMRMFIPILFLVSWLALTENFLYKPIHDYFGGLGYSHANASRIIASVGIIPSAIFYFISSYLFKIDEFELIFKKILRR